MLSPPYCPPPPPPPTLNGSITVTIWKRALFWLNFHYLFVERKGKNRMVEETSHVKQLFPNYMCKIGLTTNWPEERMVQLSNMGMQLQQPFQCGHNQSGRHRCGHSSSHLNILNRYTVKKGYRFSQKTANLFLQCTL